jgi:MFS family permease
LGRISAITDNHNFLAPGGWGYKYYVLLLLALGYVVNYLDRQILAILLPSIKGEFGLSDTALGLLAGPAFALFYAVLGIPIAWLADRFNRRNIIAISLTFFSLATLLSGRVVQFWQLFLCRVFTGIGEAGTGPSAQAMISDMYPPEKRAAAQSFYAAGLNVGLMLAFFAGGYIAEHYGWRNAFLAAGLPGIALALLIVLTLGEPVRGASEARADHGNAPAIGAMARFLWSQTSYRYIVLGTAMSAFTGYGLTAFLPSFLVRSHHLAIADIGLIFALILGLGGTAGTFLAGVIADRSAKYDMRWNLYVPALAVLISLPFWPIFFLSTNTTVAILAAIIPSSLAASYVGPCMAMMQGLAPLRMRATAAAFQLFVANAIGLGLGPQAVGIVSDLLQPAFGENSLRYAMLFGVLGAIISAFCYLRAARTLTVDITAALSFRGEEYRSVSTP